MPANRNKCSGSHTGSGDMRVEVVVVKDSPANYQTYAWELLEACKKFYQDPANVRAFEEWEAAQRLKDEKEGVSA